VDPRAVSPGADRAAIDPLSGRRTAFGTSTKLWSDRRHEVEPGRWLAFSGESSVDYNLILCHGSDGAAALGRSLDDVKAAKVPALIAVAGEALGMTNVLASAEWVCVGAQPFMVMTDIHGEPDPGARPLRPSELPAAQAMIATAFDIAPAIAEIALPTARASDPKREAWGLFDNDELVSCVGVVTVDETVVIWSMATPPAHQRRGYGRRLLAASLAGARDAGATTSLLVASPAGAPLYQSVGYTVAEYWQVWSRARWMFPPA